MSTRTVGNAKGSQVVRAKNKQKNSHKAADEKKEEQKMPKKGGIMIGGEV